MKDQLCGGAGAGKDLLFHIASSVRPWAGAPAGPLVRCKVLPPIVSCPRGSTGDGGGSGLRLVQRVRRLRSCLALLRIHLLIFRGYRGDVIDDDDDDNGNRGDRWQINS